VEFCATFWQMFINLNVSEEINKTLEESKEMRTERNMGHRSFYMIRGKSFFACRPCFSLFDSIVFSCVLHRLNSLFFPKAFGQFIWICSSQIFVPIYYSIFCSQENTQNTEIFFPGIKMRILTAINRQF
jgi:hypothetical protein